jgi:hypothetical protein
MSDLNVGAGDVTLEFVTRKVIGDIVVENTATFNDKTREIERKQRKLKDPVIVFFPTKQALVMEEAEALAKDFLGVRPGVMNLKEVPDEDASSPGGLFKNGLTTEEKLEGYMMLEDELIQKCIQTANPLPNNCAYGDDSMHVGKSKGAVANA